MQKKIVVLSGILSYLHWSHPPHKPVNAVTPHGDWALVVRLHCKLGIVLLVVGFGLKSYTLQFYSQTETPPTQPAKGWIKTSGVAKTKTKQLKILLEKKRDLSDCN
jgi:hypothetical protein